MRKDAGKDSPHCGGEKIRSCQHGGHLTGVSRQKEKLSGWDSFSFWQYSQEMRFLMRRGYYI